MPLPILSQGSSERWNRGQKFRRRQMLNEDVHSQVLFWQQGHQIPHTGVQH
nr:MAG TPA: hypothetical protein [Caudoviricetes sp.]